MHEKLFTKVDSQFSFLPDCFLLCGVFYGFFLCSFYLLVRLIFILRLSALLLLKIFLPKIYCKSIILRLDFLPDF